MEKGWLITTKYLLISPSVEQFTGKKKMTVVSRLPLPHTLDFLLYHLFFPKNVKLKEIKFNDVLMIQKILHQVRT
jgi:hypothetical protein